MPDMNRSSIQQSLPAAALLLATVEHVVERYRHSNIPCGEASF